MGVIVSSCCSCCYFFLREVIPLLQCGVPSMGDSPLKNLQCEPFPHTTVLHKLVQQWFSHGCSPSGTICFSVGSPQGQKSCQQICPCLSFSMHGFPGPCSSVGFPRSHSCHGTLPEATGSSGEWEMNALIFTVWPFLFSYPRRWRWWIVHLMKPRKAPNQCWKSQVHHKFKWTVNTSLSAYQAQNLTLFTKQNPYNFKSYCSNVADEAKIAKNC